MKSATKELRGKPKDSVTKAEGFAEVIQQPDSPTIFSLMDKAKLGADELNHFKAALRDFVEYAQDVLHSAKISSMKMEIIMEENKRSKNVTDEFQSTYKNVLHDNAEVKADALSRIRVVEKFQKMLEEVS